jgi:3-oxoacyl-[acyl-carrier-protein] synthase II
MESVNDIKPAITGIGLVSVLGRTAEETWNSLLEGRTICDHSRVPGFTAPDRAIAMALSAARQSLDRAAWTESRCAEPDSALFVATSRGVMESWLTGGPDARGLAQIDAELAMSLKFGLGPRLTISCACSSGLHALIRAATAIAGGEARRALVVAVETSVHPLFISSFKRLGVLAPEGYGCRPFDRGRKGFVISEAAAAICLEPAAEAARRPIACIDRWALGGDGTHLTGGDPSAPCLRNLLSRVIDHKPVDLIHAHGTGTETHDPMELNALSAVAAGNPIVYSHKGALGHTLGAAGLVSIVLNCLAHQNQIIPPNARLTDPIATPLSIPRRVQPLRVRRSLAIATGFGGPISVVGLSSIAPEV